METKVFNKAGKEVGSVTLKDAIFGVEINEALVHDAVVNQQTNSRAVLAHAKDRSEVRGGGRKPWRQKGTGRARHGSRRSPIWSGGGVTFGPTKVRNFAKKMNTKARRKAFFMTLTDKLNDQAFVVVDDLSLESPKTKEMSMMLKALPLKGRRILVVVDPSNKNMRLAISNIENVESIAPNSLNVVDVLKTNTLVIGQAELEFMSKHFAG